MRGIFWFSTAMSDIKTEITAFRAEFNAQFDNIGRHLLEFEERYNQRMAKSETRIVSWVIATGVATVLAMATLLRTMPH